MTEDGYVDMKVELSPLDLKMLRLARFVEERDGVLYLTQKGCDWTLEHLRSRA